jgi:hypothetical protein
MFMSGQTWLPHCGPMALKFVGEPTNLYDTWPPDDLCRGGQVVGKFISEPMNLLATWP